MYEGDGFLRDALARAAAPGPDATADTSEPSRADIAEIERLARRMRADVIAGLFARVYGWFNRASWRAQQRDVEHYLSQASDAADLERRMRTLDRARAGALGSHL
jgi:hypothetical protein